MKVIFSGPALNDLEHIGDFIGRDNPARSFSFIRELRTASKSLARYPRRFPLALGSWPGEVRRRVHGNYLIIYRVQRKEVIILRILNGAQDYEALSAVDA